jgi:hypothetical protein
MSIVATSISIILTFGTAYFVDKSKKENAKLEIAKMIIFDMDQTIKKIESNDSLFNSACQVQLQVAQNPACFDSVRLDLVDVAQIGMIKFSETTERVFSTSIETFNTIGNANFVDAATRFYINRQAYKDEIIGSITRELEDNSILMSPKALFEFDLAEYRLSHQNYLRLMKNHRNYCMSLFNISDDDMQEFAQRQVLDDFDTQKESNDSLSKAWAKEFLRHMNIVNNARKQYKE